MSVGSLARTAVADDRSVISDRDEMIREMNPVVVPGTFVYATVEGVESVPDGVVIYSTVVEPEGVSIVVSSDDARQIGIIDPVELGWITLTVNSSLEGVGLTAAVSGALANGGIACNVVAGHHHDHLLVPIDQLDRSVELLSELAAQR